MQYMNDMESISEMNMHHDLGKAHLVTVLKMCDDIKRIPFTKSKIKA